MNKYYQCPYCGKNYKGIIPKGGDGSALFYPKHKLVIPHTNNLGITILPGKKVLCEGSYQEVVDRETE